MSEITTTDQKSSKFKYFRDQTLSLTYALLAVFAIRSALVEPFRIPSGSMIPTLFVGDQIFVNKMAYGLKVPFTEWIFPEPVYLYKGAGPKRGDVIVFKYPENPDIYYIKRIVGLPGDTIEMKDKVVYVNGKPFDRGSVQGEKIDHLFKGLDKYKETYPRASSDVFTEKYDATTGLVMINREAQFSTHFESRTVPADSYFVMGDNRDNSRDSRFWGYVPFGFIKGKAALIWASVWIDFDDFSTVTHWDRIGTLIK